MLTLVCRFIVCNTDIINLMKNNENKLLNSFGTKIQDLRKKSNLSQEGLANLSGLHRTYIGMIERGEKNITLKNIEKIANALNVSLYDLFKDING